MIPNIYHWAIIHKIYDFHNLPFYEKVVLRLSGHGDVIETQTAIYLCAYHTEFVPQKFAPASLVSC